MGHMKVANDSRTLFSGWSAVEVPPCSLQDAEACDAAGLLSVRAAFQGKVVLITGTHLHSRSVYPFSRQLIYPANFVWHSDLITLL